jgi:hypothetical protein
MQLLKYKIVLIGNWHTWLIEELILKGRDRKHVITSPVTWTAEKIKSYKSPGSDQIPAEH